jgi:signal transduction histidine kinase
MARRKTGQEAKVERLTWFLMVIAFLLMTNNGFDGAATLGVVSIILLISGLYQWRKRWSVGPAVFLMAGIGLLITLYSFWQPLPFDLSLAPFVLIVAVIFVGIITNDS